MILAGSERARAEARSEGKREGDVLLEIKDRFFIPNNKTSHEKASPEGQNNIFGGTIPKSQRVETKI